MLNDITFGQYFPANSVIHRMDARIKLVLLVALIVAVFLCKNFLSLGVFTIFTLTVIFLSKIPLKLYLKNIKVIIPIIIFI